MSIIRIQGELEVRKGICYQVDSDDEPIGVGGMGQVFKGLCVNERTGATRPVAIKFMFDDLPPHAIERARREASIQLRNDNLVEMLGFIELEERTQFGEIKKHYHVVSELLNGVSLSDLMEGKTTDRDNNSVPYAEKLLQDFKNDSEHFARIVVMNILSGLMALHDAGYIHRDIDPTNIMVTEDGHIKLIDFGIAKQMRTLTTNDKGLTVAGKFMGKPEYAAPELVLGDILHQDQTTDIYAMGILLYQCIVGHTPFEGPRHEILEHQLKDKLPLKAIRNKALRNIIATACEKKQVLRYQTSAQMRVALETMNARTNPIKVGSKMFYIAVAAIVLLLFGIGTLITLSIKNDDKRPVKVIVQKGPKLTGIARVASMMKNKDTAQDGLRELEQMAEKDDPNALFLLSRLYFRSNRPGEVNSDSVISMQRALNIQYDNKKAHELLMKTISVNPQDYHALYELGCDFVGGGIRTEAVDRNLNQADVYFKDAMRYAKQRNDVEYITRIQQQMDKYTEYLNSEY